jgi:hypothetical protein
VGLVARGKVEESRARLGFVRGSSGALQVFDRASPFVSPLSSNIFFSFLSVRLFGLMERERASSFQVKVHP